MSRPISVFQTQHRPVASEACVLAPPDQQLFRLWHAVAPWSSQMAALPVMPKKLARRRKTTAGRYYWLAGVLFSVPFVREQFIKSKAGARWTGWQKLPAKRAIYIRP